MTHSKKNGSATADRKNNHVPANAIFWTPDADDDEVAEYHNPWLAVKRDEIGGMNSIPRST